MTYVKRVDQLLEAPLVAQQAGQPSNLYWEIGSGNNRVYVIAPTKAEAIVQGVRRYIRAFEPAPTQQSYIRMTARLKGTYRSGPNAYVRQVREGDPHWEEVQRAFNLVSRDPEPPPSGPVQTDFGF